MPHLGEVSEGGERPEGTGRCNVRSSRGSAGGSWPETTETNWTREGKTQLPKVMDVARGKIIWVDKGSL